MTELTKYETEEYIPTKKHKLVFDYIKEHSPVLQPHVKDHFAKVFEYKSKNSARQAIQEIIQNLERKRLITIEKIKHVDYNNNVKKIRVA